MGELEHNVVATLLLGVLFFVLVMGTALIFLVLQWRQRKAMTAQPLAEVQPERTRRPALRPSVFGLKQATCWLAIKHRSPQAVQAALALHNPHPCSWAEGMSGGSGQRVFVSPQISGWTLVIGPALPDPCEDADVCFRFVMDLSRKLGHVQMFSVNVILDHHAWVRAEGGRIARAYAWAGETLWNEGGRTGAEDDLKMECRDYAESSNYSPEGAEPGLDNSDKVHLLAARWSIDPDEIDGRSTGRAWGIAGEATRRY